MIDVKFAPSGKRDLENLSKDIQLRIVKKIKFFTSQEQPLNFAKPLVNLPPSTHRFRVGNYRIAFYIKGGTIYIERIGHRKEVYL